MTNPPSTKTSSSVNVPSVFATTSVLPILPMNRKRDRAIEFTAKNAKYCRKNLIKKKKRKGKDKIFVRERNYSNCSSIDPGHKMKNYKFKIQFSS